MKPKKIIRNAILTLILSWPALEAGKTYQAIALQNAAEERLIYVLENLDEAVARVDEARAQDALGYASSCSESERE